MDTVLNVFAIFGGIALFIFGMNIMTAGLRETAGDGLRTVLTRVGRSRLAGVTAGTFLGGVIHSSAATVMIVGFVNAGLISLPSTIPSILGANVGTTISMQAVSFNLSSYCYLAIVLGLAANLQKRYPRIGQAGLALLGFGLLFLGIETMAEAAHPFRTQLEPILSPVNGATWSGMLCGIALAAALTAIWQSSGATIAICFAFAEAGIFTSLEQVYPIVLGAHIGTCATALLGSIGTNIQARRTACAHLGFNLFNVAFAVAASPLFLRWIPLTATDLVRQTANLHTAVMVVSALIILPFSAAFARIITAVVRSNKPPPPPSFLDRTAIAKPELALHAVLAEQQRVAKVCGNSFQLVPHLMLFKHKRDTVRTIKSNEKIVNEIKRAMRDYLDALTGRYLSQRQLMLIQYVDRCMIALERIGDHIDELCDVSLRRQSQDGALMDKALLEELLGLYKSAAKVLELVIQSLDPEQQAFQESARDILDARDAFKERQSVLRVALTAQVSNQEIDPLAAVFCAQYMGVFQRIVKHARNIAMVQLQPEFVIKRTKLDRTADPAPKTDTPELADAQDFLNRLQSDDHL